MKGKRLDVVLLREKTLSVMAVHVRAMVDGVKTAAEVKGYANKHDKPSSSKTDGHVEDLQKDGKATEYNNFVVTNFCQTTPCCRGLVLR